MSRKRCSNGRADLLKEHSVPTGLVEDQGGKEEILCCLFLFQEGGGMGRISTIGKVTMCSGKGGIETDTVALALMTKISKDAVSRDRVTAERL